MPLLPYGFDQMPRAEKGFLQGKAAVLFLKLPMETQATNTFVNAAAWSWMQVHEKSILFPLLPISLLAMEHPTMAAWVPAMAAFSMFPLLKKDQLQLAYIGCLTIWAALSMPDASLKASAITQPKGSKTPQSSQGAQPGMIDRIASGSSRLNWPTVATCLSVHLLAAFYRPPERLPFLHDLMFMSVSFGSFAFLWVFLVHRCLSIGHAK